MPDSTPPQQFGNYRLGPPMGKGDMGTVYKAQDPNTKQIVALKVLDRIDTTDSDMRRGAAIEILQFAASFKHPNIHPIQQVVETPDGQVGIVMPLAAARSVNKYLSQGKRIPQKNVLQIISQLIKGLQFLHSQEIAHGSIKPTNVLLDAQGNATLSDLPMAHIREFGYVPMSPTTLQMYYMPAEAAYHGAPEVMYDVFSLGCLSYHLLTGRLPFDDPEPLARKRPPLGDLPPKFFAVLMRAMTERRELRYRTIDDFAKELQGANRGEIDPDTERIFRVDAPPPDDEDGINE